MADQPKPPLPAGFQRPGVPGAGNILDPAVRGELRGKLHDAIHGARPQPPEQKPAPESDATSGPPATTETPAPAETPTSPGPGGIGPFAHGDVDLRTHPANVFQGVRPKRGRTGRKFYFLPETPPAGAEESPKPEKLPAGTEESPKPEIAAPLPPKKPG